MHKLIVFILFETSLWWYLYRYQDLNFKALKRLVVSGNYNFFSFLRFMNKDFSEE